MNLLIFLMVSMAFTALQVETVKAEEESLDGATQIFSGSEESSEKKKKIEQRDRKTEQRDQERQDRDRKDTGSQVEENIPIEHDIYSIDRWGIRGGAKARAAWQNRDQTN